MSNNLNDYQGQVVIWLKTCFGEETAKDKTERSLRFIEEALELVQATGTSKEDVLKLVDYVYSRPIGEIEQEVGGVMTTLPSLCYAWDILMGDAGLTELDRCWERINIIREKQKNKPHRSPFQERFEGGSMAYKKRLGTRKVPPYILMHFQIAEWLLEGPPRTRRDFAEAFLVDIKTTSKYFYAMNIAGLMVNLKFRNGRNRGHEFVPVKRIVPYTEEVKVVETCTSGHRFARLSSHPKKATGEWACPFCLLTDLDKERNLSKSLLFGTESNNGWELQSLVTKSIAG